MSTLFRWDRGRESSPADMFKAVYDPDDDGSVKSADAVPWTGVTGKPSNYPAEAHNLLSAGHGDTLAASVAAGDLLIGNSTPKWARLAKGSRGQVLRMGASLPEWISDDGWIPRSETWTRLSNTTFRVTGNLTADFPAGAKIKVTQTTTKYFYVVGASYSSPYTTVTITGGSDYSLTASPTARWCSYAVTPQGFPGWFNYSPGSTTGWVSPTYHFCRFLCIGRGLWVNVRVTGTSNSATTNFALPVSAASIYGTAEAFNGACGYAQDAGVGLTTPAYWSINSGGTVVNFYKDFSAAGFTPSGTKLIMAEFSYEW